MHPQVLYFNRFKSRSEFRELSLQHPVFRRAMSCRFHFVAMREDALDRRHSTDRGQGGRTAHLITGALLRQRNAWQPRSSMHCESNAERRMRSALSDHECNRRRPASGLGCHEGRLGRLRAAVLMSLSVAACAIDLWALDATSAGSAAGQWTVTKLRLTGGRFDLPVKVGTAVIIEPDGFFAPEHRGANRIGILGRGLCSSHCFTLYNFWVSIAMTFSYRATPIH
jgi:hypothetical protein